MAASPDAPGPAEIPVLPEGLQGQAEVTVTQAHTARHFSSGAVDAFATPALLALMEHAAVLAVTPHLPPGLTTVGVGVQMRHLAATPVGLRVRARARLTRQEGRRLWFEVEAFDPVEKVGEAVHERFIVEEDRFYRRLQAKGDSLGAVGPAGGSGGR